MKSIKASEMKNIKVNIINHSGKKTSTTINVNIALYYYKYCVPQSEKDFIREYDVSEQYAAAVTHRNKCIQDYTNRLIEEGSTVRKHVIGVDQQYIETRLLNEIKYSD